MKQRRRMFGPVGAIALLLAATAAACGGESEGGPAPADGDSAYPVTVTDLLGRAVTIDSAPERVVTTSPSAIELLADVGGTAIARSTTATALPRSAELADVGPSYGPSFEQIVALDPDLVIADASAQAHLAGAFEQALAGTPTLFVGARAYADLAASARILGRAIGNPDGGEAAAAAFEQIAGELGGGGDPPPPAPVLVAGRDGTLSAALDASFIGDLVALLGAENVAASLPQSGPVPGYALLSPESIVSLDPDVLLIITPGGGPSIAQLVSARLPDLAAVRSGRVHEVDLEVYLQAPGPRSREGLRALDALIHPG